MGEAMLVASEPRRFEPSFMPAADRPTFADARLPDAPFPYVVGASRALREVLRQVGVVAPTDATVLVLGETGTGKELIARAVHDRSPRRARAFVKLNCAAIPSGLLESELFGHERGAFTGAVARRAGRFELADGGTLFLDEVGDMPLDVQAKVLRVLQEQEFERLGATRTTKVNVRLIAATHRDLQDMMRAGTFRADLYYRLNVFPIDVPPLRARPDDIEPLVRHFVARFARRMQRSVDTISEATLAALRRHPWPGNVRELENLVERSVILSTGRLLAVPLEQLSSGSFDGGAPSSLEAAQRAHVTKVLASTSWKIGGPSGAAAQLGMKRTTLQSLMQRLAITRPDRR
jgi:formate hydrogenlyase transcriptional activator